LKKLLLLGVCAFALTGCATANFTKTNYNYPDKIAGIKKVAVMPIDFKVFQISAGGVTEEMDEWSKEAKDFIKQALKDSLGGRDLQLSFIEEKDFDGPQKDIWFAQKGMYGAVISSALTHAYPGMNTFEDKANHFDYTLGEEFQQLSQKIDADALLFIQGFDTRLTTGKVVMDALWAGIGGVYMIYFDPMNMALIDPETGDVLWMKLKDSTQGMNFAKKTDVDKVVKWFSQDFLVQP